MSVEDNWLEFKRETIDSAAVTKPMPPELVEMLRRAFISGIASMYGTMMEQVEKAGPEEFMVFMEGMRDALREFVAELHEDAPDGKQEDWE